MANMRQLLQTLEREGIDVPHSAEFRALNDACNVMRPELPELSGPLLGLSADVLYAHALEYGLARAVKDEQLRRLNALARRLFEEMIDVLREEAERIVSAIAPAYDAAADVARAVVAAGARPNDDAETLAENAPDALPLWLAFRREPYARLVRLATVRADLAVITGEQGLSDGDDISITVTRPYFDVLTPDDRHRRRPPWARWLEGAGSLRMVLPSELDPADVLNARRYDAGAIYREAARRESLKAAAAVSAGDTAEQGAESGAAPEGAGYALADAGAGR